MAVTIGEKVAGSTLSMQRVGRRIVRRYREAFFVYSDDMRTGPIEVAITTGLATMRDWYQSDYEFDLGAKVEDISITQDGSEPQKYLCEVSYSTQVEDALTGNKAGDNTGSPTNGGDLRSDPVKRPTVVRYSRRARKQPLEYDFTFPNKALVNAAGQKFDPPYEQDVYNRVITIEWFTRGYSRDLAERLEDGCNSKTWSGYAPYTARLIEWQAEEMEEDGWIFFKNKAEIEIQKPDWKLRILNEGSSYIDRNSGEHRRIMGTDALALDGKQLLDARGFRLPRTQAAADISDGVQTITPVSMENIASGDHLLIGIDNNTAPTEESIEEVEVISITATTFTAAFAGDHYGPVPISGVPVFLEFEPFPRIDFRKLRIQI